MTGVILLKNVMSHFSADQSNRSISLTFSLQQIIELSIQNSTRYMHDCILSSVPAGLNADDFPALF